MVMGRLRAGILGGVRVTLYIPGVMRDVCEVPPPMLKESAYSLGATTWEVVWRVVLPYTKIGVTGGGVPGLGPAPRETMAGAFRLGKPPRPPPPPMAPGPRLPPPPPPQTPPHPCAHSFSPP